MSKMNNLDKNQIRLLALLEEAGEEEISTILNSMAGSEGEQMSLPVFLRTLDSLRKVGYIDIAVRIGDDFRLSPEPRSVADKILATLSTKLKWSDKGRRWVWIGEEVPHLVVTEAGLKIGQQILGQQGWQVRGIS